MGMEFFLWMISLCDGNHFKRNSHLADPAGLPGCQLRRCREWTCSISLMCEHRRCSNSRVTTPPKSSLWHSMLLSLERTMYRRRFGKVRIGHEA